MHRTMLLVGWPWKMVAINVVSAGHLGRRETCEPSEWGPLNTCECGDSPLHLLSPWNVPRQMDSQSVIGIEQQMRSPKALTSCHIQAQIAVFAATQVQPESLPQGWRAIVSIHTSVPLRAILNIHTPMQYTWASYPYEAAVWFHTFAAETHDQNMSFVSSAQLTSGIIYGFLILKKSVLIPLTLC